MIPDEDLASLPGPEPPTGPGVPSGPGNPSAPPEEPLVPPPTPAPDPGPAAPPANPGETVPGEATLPPSLHEPFSEMLQMMLNIWADRAAPTQRLEAHRSELERIDLLVTRMSKADQETPAIQFIQGASHFLVARGIFEEFLEKRRAARTKVELKRVIEQYEGVYKGELKAAQDRLKKPRKAFPESFAAVILDDLARAWSADDWTAGKGKEDTKKDLTRLRPLSQFERDLDRYCTENGMPQEK